MPNWRDEARERAKEKGEGNSLKLKEGDNSIRLLPDKKDLMPDGKLNPKGVQSKPYREYRIHRNLGPDNYKATCGKKMDGTGKCWACDVKIPELRASGNPAKKLTAEKIGPQEQFLVNGARFDPDKQVWSMPKPWWASTGNGIPGKQSQSLAVKVLSKISSLRRDVIDPVKGYNLNIEKTGEGMKTRYGSVETDESPSKVPLKVLASVVSLDEIIPPYDEAEMKALYFGKPRPERDEIHDEEPDEDADAEEESPEELEEDADTDADTEDDPEAKDVEDAAEEDSEYEAEGDEAEPEKDIDEDAETEDTDEDAEYEAEEAEEPEPEPEPPPKKKKPALAPAKPAAKKPAPASAKKPVRK